MNAPNSLVVHPHHDFTAYWLAAVIFLIAYFLPTFIAFVRGHNRKGAIFFLNIIIGWTGLGWLYLMLTALEFL